MSSDGKKRFQLTRVQGQRVSDVEILADLKNVASEIGATTVGILQYVQHGHYASSTIMRRFGSWNKALLAAGLTFSNELNISDERLFENILLLWQYFGRQPRLSELAKAPSTISHSPYKRRFRSWIGALKAFIDYADTTGADVPACRKVKDDQPSTGRDPSLRLRWKVLKRDHFTCRGCGASPAIHPGTDLHVDHVDPWSKGGETTLENLQTLCSKCNLGKSDSPK